MLTGGSFLALTERTIEPGLTQDSSGIFIIRFDTDNMTILPNGNYSFWIYAEDNPDVISHLTNLSMINGEPFIDYFITTVPTPPPTTTPPTLTIKIEYLTISISAIGCFLYIIKKKRKKISENF